MPPCSGGDLGGSRRWDERNASDPAPIFRRRECREILEGVSPSPGCSYPAAGRGRATRAHARIRHPVTSERKFSSVPASHYVGARPSGPTDGAVGPEGRRHTETASELLSWPSPFLSRPRSRQVTPF